GSTRERHRDRMRWRRQEPATPSGRGLVLLRGCGAAAGARGRVGGWGERSGPVCPASSPGAGDSSAPQGLAACSLTQSPTCTRSIGNGTMPSSTRRGSALDRTLSTGPLSHLEPTVRRFLGAEKRAPLLLCEPITSQSGHPECRG